MKADNSAIGHCQLFGQMLRQAIFCRIFFEIQERIFKQVSDNMAEYAYASGLYKETDNLWMERIGPFMEQTF